MKILYLIIPLLLTGCATGSSHVSGSGVPEIPFIAIYYEEEFLGAIGIAEGRRTEVPFENFIDAGNGEMVGLGVGIIAENFAIAEGSAKGRLEVTKRWIDPEPQATEASDPRFPIFSVQSSRSEILLKAGSMFHVFTVDGEGMTTGYDLDRTDGWRFLLVTNEAQNPAR